MAEQSPFRTVMGVVQFPPKDGNAGGKPVRNITVRQTGFGEQNVRVSATLWPSHAHIAVAEGDVVVLEGKFSRNTVQKEDGGQQTFNNMSVTRIAVLGQTDAGTKPDVENAPDEPVNDDDIPF